MKDFKNPFFVGSQLTWEDLGNGIYRQIMGFNDHIMLVKVKFDKGSIGYIHQHFHSQVTYVAEGVFEVNINNIKQVLHTGDSFYAEPNAPHGVECIEEGILVDVFSPMRGDFLSEK